MKKFNTSSPNTIKVLEKRSKMMNWLCRGVDLQKVLSHISS